MLYQIVMQLNVERLEKDVMQFIFSGWEPLGSPFLVRSGNVCQAMIKKPNNASGS